MNHAKVIAQIDAVRAKTHQALRQKEVNKFMEIFAEDLKYYQKDGQKINKSQLLKDQKNYFNRIQSYESNFERINFLVEKDYFKETITQKATIAIKVFLFFQKKWTIEREGIYEWKKVAGNWKISQVKILQEQIRVCP